MGFYYWGVRFREGGVLLIGGKDFIVKWGLNGLKVLEERCLEDWVMYYHD